jgi:hypothetical protein
MNTPDSSPRRQNKPKTPKKPPKIVASFTALRPAGIAGERDGDFLAPRVRGAFVCHTVLAATRLPLSRQTRLCSFAISLGEIAHCVRNST